MPIPQFAMSVETGVRISKIFVFPLPILDLQEKEPMPSLALDLVAQPTAACPNCGSPVPLTEALAAPLLEATRADYESKLSAQKDEFQAQQQALVGRERAAEEARQQLEKREADLKRKEDEAHAEIGTQRAQLAAEVARQTEAAVAKQLAERLAIEKKLIIEEEQHRAAQHFADELAGRDRNETEQANWIERLQAKLTASQNAEAELRRREQDFRIVSANSRCGSSRK